MSGQDALGAQFSEHVASFRDRYHERGFHDEDVCEGQCATATGLFARHLDKQGVKHSVMELDQPDHEDERGGDVVNHFVNVIPHPKTGEPHVVDWTARQFDHTAGYPHVQPLAAYKEHMGMHEATAGWEGYGSSREVVAASARGEHLHDEDTDTWSRAGWQKRNMGAQWGAR